MRHRGKVKWWNDERGFGFIQPLNGDGDVFVHFTGIEGRGRRSLEDVQEVEYGVEMTAKGLQAVGVITI
jgi:cold shock protein